MEQGEICVGNGFKDLQVMFGLIPTFKEVTGEKMAAEGEAFNQPPPCSEQC